MFCPVLHNGKLRHRGKRSDLPEVIQETSGTSGSKTMNFHELRVFPVSGSANIQFRIQKCFARFMNGEGGMSSAVFWILQPTLIWAFRRLQLHHCQEELRSHRDG